MGRTYEVLTEQLGAWITEQPLFFVATAPSDGGHVNLSPKGYDTFRVLGPMTVAYVDYTGSGAETIAHLRDNGRVTVMFCSFGPKPRILRLYGRGEAVFPDDDTFDGLMEHFDAAPGIRSIIRIELDRIADSCGYGVPVMELVGERPTMAEWGERQGPDGVVTYQGKKNRTSIDGLAAVDRPATIPIQPIEGRS